mmetsp:Transcript_1757/g.1847  ORF Transcript_1757/g.1847 Transcript_1757/m.1847 type:complete len:270 (-) Transcript_1757:396-1205(-)
MASSSSAPMHSRRPNRSAASRRQQYARAHARTMAGILNACSSLHGHRGNEPNRSLSTVASLLRSGASPAPQGSAHAHTYPQQNSGTSDLLQHVESFSHKLQQQCNKLDQYFYTLHSQLQHLFSCYQQLETSFAIFSSPQSSSLSGQHSLDELVDHDTLQRIRRVQESSNTSESQPAAPLIAGKRSTYTFAASQPAEPADVVSTFVSSSASRPSDIRIVGKQSFRTIAFSDPAKAEEVISSSAASSAQVNCSKCGGTGWASKFSRCNACS